MTIDQTDECPKRDDKFITGLQNQFTICLEPDDNQVKVKFYKEHARLILPLGAVLVLSGSFKLPEINYTDVNSAIEKLNLTELNQVVFSCEKEEQSNNPGNGCYNVPFYGALPYAGFGGVYQLLERILSRRDNHSLTDNIKHGTWLVDYLISRLQSNELKHALLNVFDNLKEELTFTNRAYYSIQFIQYITDRLIRQIINMNPKWLTSTFYGRLSALSCTALFGQVKGAHWPLNKNSQYYQIGSLCAGLPHFAEGIWRCWGRDTLISLRGSLLLTTRRDEALAGLISFGSTLRHGLIPNLLGEGKVSRYNCRDATWFWLNSVCDFYESDPAIFNQLVPHGFINDDADFNPNNAERSIEMVVYDILDRHGKGIEFRERNAGPNIDMNMDDRLVCIDFSSFTV